MPQHIAWSVHWFSVSRWPGGGMCCCMQAYDVSAQKAAAFPQCRPPAIVSAQVSYLVSFCFMQMGASVQSLAHEIALAAAKKAQHVSRNIEAAADTSLSQSPRATQVATECVLPDCIHGLACLTCTCLQGRMLLLQPATVIIWLTDVQGSIAECAYSLHLSIPIACNCTLTLLA